MCQKHSRARVPSRAGVWLLMVKVFVGWASSRTGGSESNRMESSGQSAIDSKAVDGRMSRHKQRNCYQIATKLNEWDRRTDSWGISPSYGTRVVVVVARLGGLLFSTGAVRPNSSCGLTGTAGKVSCPVSERLAESATRAYEQIDKPKNRACRE
jgi:hypothetical protein